MEEGARGVLEGREGVVVELELVLDDAVKIGVKAKTKNDNQLGEEFSLGVRRKKRGNKNGREVRLGEERLEEAGEEGEIELGEVLDVENVVVSVGDGVGGRVVKEVEEEACAHGLQEHLRMKISEKENGNQGVKRRGVGDVCGGEEKEEREILGKKGMQPGEGILLEGEVGGWREILRGEGKCGIVHARMKRGREEHAARWERMEWLR